LANSEKSRQTNPQFKPKQVEVENKDLDEMTSGDEEEEVKPENSNQE
jgi:hypothetical protein